MGDEEVTPALQVIVLVSFHISYFTFGSVCFHEFEL